MNICHLLGKVVTDPTLESTNSGRDVCRFKMVTQSGKNHNPNYHWVVVLGKNPEDQHPSNVKKFLRRGSSVQVTGRISENKWQHRETGDWRSRTEIVASSIQFLGSMELRTSTGSSNSSSDERVLESVVEQGN